MNQKEVLEFDGFRVERESFLGGDCYGIVTSCKKDEKGEVSFFQVLCS